MRAGDFNYSLPSVSQQPKDADDKDSAGVRTPFFDHHAAPISQRPMMSSYGAESSAPTPNSGKKYTAASGSSAVGRFLNPGFNGDEIDDGRKYASNVAREEPSAPTPNSRKKYTTASGSSAIGRFLDPGFNPK